MQQAEREAQLQQWARGQLAALSGTDPQAIDWTIIAGDASFRRYFRLKAGAQRFIAMDAPPPQEDVATFSRVAGLMRDAGLRVPAIYAEQQQNGFMLLEDFGDHMLRDELGLGRGQQLFDDILPGLGRMVHCSTEGLPRFDAAAMQAELDLFSDWYLGRHCQFDPDAAQREHWQQLCSLLIEEALEQPQHFVHRDFHSCNLHRIDSGDPGIIDFQDAVLGPASYDLASWLWDRYISWPRSSLETWMEQARPLLAPLLEVSHWQKCCDWMGLQRNLKIIGIFARLNYRDGKREYLDLLPRFASYVRDVLPRYSAFRQVQPQLHAWLEPCGAP